MFLVWVILRSRFFIWEDASFISYANFFVLIYIDSAMLISFLIIFLIQLVCFLIAYFFQTDKLTDISYGGTFIIMVIYLFLQSQQDVIHRVLLCIVFVWGIRLGAYLLVRIHHMSQDTRFDNMRPSFIKFWSFWFLQAVSIMILMLPIIFLMSKEGIGFHRLILLWGIISFVGIVLESLADRQKYQFKKLHPNRWCDIWVWSKARHPNYFGEMLVWRGVFIACIPWLISRELLSIVSPLWITLLLLKISWIPLLVAKREERYGSDPEFQQWKSETNLLIPL